MISFYFYFQVYIFCGKENDWLKILHFHIYKLFTHAYTQYSLNTSSPNIIFQRDVIYSESLWNFSASYVIKRITKKNCEISREELSILKILCWKGQVIKCIYVLKHLLCSVHLLLDHNASLILNGNFQKTQVRQFLLKKRW